LVHRRVSLAGQFLALQLAIVVVVLVAVAAVSLAQADAGFRRDEGRRVLSVAETVAAVRSVRLGLANPAMEHVVPPVAESARSVSGASYVIVARADGTVLTSPDPRQVGEALELRGSPVLTGRSWVGVAEEGGDRYVVGHVPVLDDRGRILGLVAVGRAYPTLLASLWQASPNLLTYLGLASVLGVAGSLLLARRVKRQTLGLEPREITGLVEHHEAMLHGIREGVVGLGLQHRVTLVNDEAVRLLDLPERCVGRRLDELGLEEPVCRTLTGNSPGRDQVVLLGDRVLILNRMPFSVRGRSIGWVTTLRDHTELIALQRELDVTRHTTDTLRAQAHEFTNQLHTIAGLIELGEYQETVQYVTRLSKARARLSAEVVSRIADPSLAALLIAKSSLAAEQGVRLRISPQTRLPRVEETLSADLVTVVGNLVDNALDALGAASDGWVEVEVTEDTEENPNIVVTVRDCGPGVAPELAQEVFRHGFSTKGAADGRGLGLALTRLVCQRRGGDIAVRNDGGAVFTARLPMLGEHGHDPDGEGTPS
jgi:sensor histidine kinase regulating citrate/malate metabolism